VLARYPEKQTSAPLRDIAALVTVPQEAGAEELARLRVFFKTVAELTLKHKRLTLELADGPTSDYAVVWPSDLGVTLEAVDPRWFTEALRTRRS
jgi:hypothetical protein